MKREFGLAAGLFMGIFTILAIGQGPAPQNPQVPPPGMQVGTEFGFAIFQQQCMGCHGNPNAPLKAPEPSALRQLTPEAILDALTTGAMKVQGQALSDAQKKQVSESLSGRPLGTATEGEAANMPNRCATNPPLPNPSSAAAWNGWGADVANTRFQSAKAAGLTKEDVPRLTLKWAFGYPNGVSALSQPTVVSGRLFVGADTGYVYSLDANTGCVYWSFKTKAGVRSALSVGPVSGRAGAKHAAYVGDLLGNVYALDARTGALLWTGHPEEHFTARVTGAPTLHNGRLYVPISSWEEFSAASLDYPCCTSRGSVAAFDANTGRQLWKTYVIPEDPQPVRKNSKGVQLWAPAGGSVWNSPTVDVRRRAIYFGTGDATTAPAAKTSDAVMALDMDTGKVRWSYQAFPNDSFLVGCDGPNKSDNCPVVQGPDLDIPASPILRTLSGGRRVLLVATKPGDLIALDPDRNGVVIWKRHIGNAPNTDIKEGALAAFIRFGIMWGGAADTENAYFGLSGGSVAAVRLATGEGVWTTALAPPVQTCVLQRGDLAHSGRGVRWRQRRHLDRPGNGGRTQALGIRHGTAVHHGQQRSGKGRSDQRAGCDVGWRDGLHPFRLWDRRREYWERVARVFCEVGRDGPSCRQLLSERVRE
jgi:polyvinyl alcohol dehydrogenase (cytochrome)